MNIRHTIYKDGNAMCVAVYLSGWEKLGEALEFFSEETRADGQYAEICQPATAAMLFGLEWNPVKSGELAHYWYLDHALTSIEEDIAEHFPDDQIQPILAELEMAEL